MSSDDVLVIVETPNTYVVLNSFLNDVDRIATVDYVPSDEDVVRARLRTTGVQEYHFILDRGENSA